MSYASQQRAAAAAATSHGAPAGRAGANPSGRFTVPRTGLPSSPTTTSQAHFGASSNTASDIAGSTPKATRGKNVQPKPWADAWHYRNAPGMGQKLDGKPLPGSYRNLRDLKVDTSIARQESSSPGSMRSPNPLPLRGDINPSSPSTQVFSPPSPSPLYGFAADSPPKRTSQNLRSKLAKSASKLGLKPMTQSGLTESTPLTPPPLLYPGATGADLTPPSLPVRTSAITNAPLIVPKLSPMPEAMASGTPSSVAALAPSDLHSAGVGAGHSWPSPLLTPHRSWDAGEGSMAPPRPLTPGSRASSRNSNRRASKGPLRPAATDAASVSRQPLPGDTKTENRSEKNHLRNGPPPCEASVSPTPAEIVRMEAEAGIATLPEKPSFPSPGALPSGDHYHPDNEHSFFAAHPDVALKRPLARRPVKPSADQQDHGRSSAQTDPPDPACSSHDLEKRLEAFTWDQHPPTKASLAADHTEAPLPQAAQAPPQPTPSAPFFVRTASHATATSKAVSDTSDVVAPAPFKQPGRQIAGKAPVPHITTDLVEKPSAVDPAMNNQGDDDAIPQPGALSVVSERSPATSSTSSANASMDQTQSSAMASPSHPAQSSRAASKSPLPPLPQPESTSAAQHKPRGRDDFEFGDILGEGSYSTVMLAWDLCSSPNFSAGGPRPKPATSAAAAMSGSGSLADPKLLEDKKQYAVKVLDKVHILKERKQKYVAVEKEALTLLLKHPGIINLYWTFQDRESLYFVLELAPNGDLLSYIKRYGSFDVSTARYYSAQLLAAIGNMHSVGVIHRDVKPENVLLDKDMHVRVADFGSAKIVPPIKKSAPSATQDSAGEGSANTAAAASAEEADRERASSFVGTAEYVSPELLTDKAASEASDFWAFGCVVFQMLAGRPPFKASSEYQTFQKIIHRDFAFPEDFDPVAKDLVSQLLTLEPKDRLGSASRGGIEAIKRHDFFSGLDWARLWQTPAVEMQTGIKAPATPPAAPASLSIGDPSDGLSDSRDWMDDDASFVHDDPGSMPDSEAVPEVVAVRNVPEQTYDTSEAMATQRFEVQPATQAGPDNRLSRVPGGRVDPASSVESISQTAASSVNADADDDASSASDHGQHSTRRRGLSSGSIGGERFGSLRRGHSLFKIASSIAGVDRRDSAGADRRDSASAGADRRDTASAGASPHPDTMAAQQGRPLLSTADSSSSLDISRSSVGPARAMGQIAASGTPPPPGMMMNWAALLLASEQVLYASPAIHKKTGTANLQSKRRTLLLTDFPRLLCVKEDNVSLKVKSEVLLGTPSGPNFPGNGRTPAGHGRVGSVPALNTFSSRRGSVSTSSGSSSSPNSMLSVEQRGVRSFVVHTPSRAYHYDDPSGDASHWVRSIQNAASDASRQRGRPLPAAAELLGGQSMQQSMSSGGLEGAHHVSGL